LEYGRFKSYLDGLGLESSFVALCLKRVGEVEQRYGKDIEILVVDDDAMVVTLEQLEWKVEKNDLDNYQNAIKHYYKMVHGCKFQWHVLGNRRLK